jgi:hypothetical protein
MMDEPTITITVKEYEGLQRAVKKLIALEVGGVDNWEWYDASLEQFFSEETA